MKETSLHSTAMAGWHVDPFGIGVWNDRGSHDLLAEAVFPRRARSKSPRVARSLSQARHEARSAVAGTDDAPSA